MANFCKHSKTGRRDEQMVIRLGWLRWRAGVLAPDFNWMDGCMDGWMLFFALQDAEVSLIAHPTPWQSACRVLRPKETEAALVAAVMVQAVHRRAGRGPDVLRSGGGRPVAWHRSSQSTGHQGHSKLPRSGRHACRRSGPKWP